MRALATIAALAVCTTASAADFQTVEEAVAAASANCLALSDGGSVEYATAIVATPDGYRTSALTRGDADSFRFTVKLAHGEKLAALFHTHNGGDALADLFSENDLQQADFLGIPSYILVTSAHHVREYIPHVSVTYTLGQFSSYRTSRGRIVALNTTSTTG